MDVRTNIGVACLLAAGLLAGCGAQSQAQTVKGVVVAYIEGAQADCCTPGLHVTSVTVRVSRVDPRWAAALVEADDAHGTAVGSVVAVLHRVRSRWRVLDIGSAEVGCGMPRPIRREFRRELKADMLNGVCP